MKIIPHKHHPYMYILHTDEDKYLGAGIGPMLDETRIVWYSGTADVPDTEVWNRIKTWVASLGGSSMGGGMCTPTQSWNEWRIPIKFDDLLKVNLGRTPHVKDDEFICDGCNKTFDIEDSIRVGKDGLRCPDCA